MATRDDEGERSLLNNFQFDFRYKYYLNTLFRSCPGLLLLPSIHGLITWLLDFPLYDGLCVNVCESLKKEAKRY